MISKVSTTKSQNGMSMVQNNAELDSRLSALESKLDSLIEILNQNPLVVQNCKRSDNGVRKISL